MDLYYIDLSMLAQELLKPDIENLKRLLGVLAQPRNHDENPETLEEIQKFIENEWQSLGYRVHHHAFSYNGNTFENLIVDHPRNLSEDPLIIGAHFDAVPGSPGADDNASGVAVMLEASRILSQQTPKIPVRFIAFHLEEYGMLGSQAYARDLRKNKEGIRGMISLEMVGYTSQEKGSQKLPVLLRPFYPDKGNFIALVGNTKSKKFLKETRRSFQSVQGLPLEEILIPFQGWLLPAVRLSDHSSFWDQGYPSLLVTDTSFFRNPHYHTLRDTVDTLNFEFLSQVTEAVVRLALAK
ncbi:MAG: M20/M25/M40 family metallo-hydrolase [Candidatus Omnitrophica bacterium]|nr:M20/M25/M40 family metallo-hydrolase [Candidatus Omnitrophota bacterium]